MLALDLLQEFRFLLFRFVVLVQTLRFDLLLDLLRVVVFQRHLRYLEQFEKLNVVHALDGLRGELRAPDLVGDGQHLVDFGVAADIEVLEFLRVEFFFRNLEFELLVPKQDRVLQLLALSDRSVHRFSLSSHKLRINYLVVWAKLAGAKLLRVCLHDHCNRAISNFQNFDFN